MPIGIDMNNYDISMGTGQIRMSGGGGIAGNVYFNGNVGIGTNNPQYTLDVNGFVNAKNLFKYWSSANMGLNINASGRYYLIATLEASGDGANCGSLKIKGSLGGFTKSEANFIDCSILSRDSGTIPSVTGTLLKTYNGTTLKYVDIRIFRNTTTGKYSVYLIVDGYFIDFELNVSGNYHGFGTAPVLYDPIATNYITSNPAGNVFVSSVLNMLPLTIVGGTSLTDARMGVGTSSPTDTLDVSGTVKITGQITIPSISNNYTSGAAGFLSVTSSGVLVNFKLVSGSLSNIGGSGSHNIDVTTLLPNVGTYIVTCNGAGSSNIYHFILARSNTGLTIPLTLMTTTSDAYSVAPTVSGFNLQWQYRSLPVSNWYYEYRIMPFVIGNLL